jgi:hypothetical protein
MLPSFAPQTAYEATCRMALSLQGTVRLARALVEDHREVDMAGLESEIGVLCAFVLDLPPDQGRLLLPLLTRLAGAVHALATSLADR